MIISALRNIVVLIQRFIDWLYIPFKKLIPEETFRYTVCGGSNTMLDIFLYFVCYHFILNNNVLQIGSIAISPHIAAFIIVFPITFSTGFLLSRYITFTESKRRKRIQLFRYGLTVLICIFLNYILLKLFVEYYKIYPTPSKILTSVIVIIYSYISNKYYTFTTETSKDK